MKIKVTEQEKILVHDITPKGPDYMKIFYNLIITQTTKLKNNKM